MDHGLREICELWKNVNHKSRFLWFTYNPIADFIRNSFKKLSLGNLPIIGYTKNTESRRWNIF